MIFDHDFLYLERVWGTLRRAADQPHSPFDDSLAGRAVTRITSPGEGPYIRTHTCPAAEWRKIASEPKYSRLIDGARWNQLGRRSSLDASVRYDSALEVTV